MLTAIKGTRDILPEEAARWHRLEETTRRVFARYGMGEMRTPMFEDSRVFLKGTGETTDIVQKEMYRFTDLGENDLTLRPEGTPPVIRAYVEHAIGQGRSIDRFYYLGPMFRYERPQKGRYRQFHQVGAEILGIASPRMDAELLEMCAEWLDALGIKERALVVNTVGDEETRGVYRTALVEAQAERLDELCADCRKRHVTNPLRVLDCKVPGCQAVIAALPIIHDFLSSASGQHFEGFCTFLEQAGIEYTVSPRMVRGLDYYRDTVFEITSSRLGSQDSLLGGGRYDGLVERMGGTDVPGVGFASGLERVLMAIPESADEAPLDVFVVAFNDDSDAAVHDLVRACRQAGLRAATAAYDGRSKRVQSRAALRSGAAWRVVVGPDEIAVDRFEARRLADDFRVEGTAATLAAGILDARSPGTASRENPQGS